MIIHLTASRRRALSFSAQLSRPKQGVVSVLPGIGKEEVTLLLEGTLDSGKPGREGMKYRVAMRLISKGGKQNISAERGITLTQGREHGWCFLPLLLMLLPVLIFQETVIKKFVIVC